MKNLAMLITLLLLSGCAANFSTKKYVEGNTFVSEGMPTVTIQVSSGFVAVDSNDERRSLVDDLGATDSFGGKMFSASFVSKYDRNVVVLISTEYTLEKGWSFLSADFNSWPGKIDISEQEVNGRRFDTAVIQDEVDQTIFLQKVFYALYGSQSSLTIVVMKRLERRMFDSPPYSREAKEMLASFNELADGSFRIVQ